MNYTTPATRLAAAEAAALAALDEYRLAVKAAGALEDLPLTYTPPSALVDTHTYNVADVNALAPFVGDDVLEHAATSKLPTLQTLLLSLSPHWEDRIRAAVLRADQHQAITLPDGFPCIYEPADSPKNARALRATPFAWVVSPDEGMLHELLPFYRELWEAYENQWPHSPNRTFEIGRLDRLSPRGVYRPGTTPAEVIGHTMLTHRDMYRTAPEHLREMHPLHEQWSRGRENRTRP
ncbi:hypothetical protein ACFVU2_19785 [Leifsonia sp. NPDC058194]|uniref:hypothetical protein n=1 Tax=Leifsonia sp. NPDC058194 TaxID=3346374 RepID=UPI0036DE8A30